MIQAGANRHGGREPTLSAAAAARPRDPVIDGGRSLPQAVGANSHWGQPTKMHFFSTSNKVSEFGVYG